MKRCIGIVLLGMLICGAVRAQRMLPGQKGVELSAGLLPGLSSGANYFVNLGMTFNGQSGNYGLMAAEYAQTHSPYRSRGILSQTTTVEGGYSLQLLGNLRKTITLNSGLSALAGFGSVNRGDSVLYDGAILRTREGFVYGLAARLSFETYLCDSFVLMLYGKAKVLQGATRNKFRTYPGLGLRFNF